MKRPYLEDFLPEGFTIEKEIHSIDYNFYGRLMFNGIQIGVIHKGVASAAWDETPRREGEFPLYRCEVRKDDVEAMLDKAYLQYREADEAFTDFWRAQSEKANAARIAKIEDALKGWKP